MRPKEPCTRSTKLQCNWQSVTVLSDGELEIALPKGNCCDMAGAISFAESVMPSVWRIVTTVDGMMDTEYAQMNGKWLAFGPGRKTDK